MIFVIKDPFLSRYRLGNIHILNNGIICMMEPSILNSCSPCMYRDDSDCIRSSGNDLGIGGGYCYSYLRNDGYVITKILNRSLFMISLARRIISNEI